ncbi:MAG: hypothetical protein JO151_21570 [Verrucomicrobia bacterium]|nr:hypothetical protein [Verrucomicrobiota bacterium]MBV8226030.1 hypothetical protein [Verrucomicrobiota bacterium]
MKWCNDIHSLVDIIYVHPSLAEVVRSAAWKAAGMLPTSCRHVASKWQRGHVVQPVPPQRVLIGLSATSIAGTNCEGN